jgi:hypothetical protein
MPRTRGTTIKKSNNQRGKSNLKIDRIRPSKDRNALPPGLRRSARGKKYFENRKNRSDLFGKV